MKHLSIALVYISFFGLIGVACYITKSSWPLWALLLTPTYKTTNEDDKE